MTCRKEMKLSKKPPKYNHHLMPHQPDDSSNESANHQATAFLNKELFVEAKVTVNPDVSIGPVMVECYEAEIEPISTTKNKSDECTVIVSQLIRVKIPLQFSAKVDAEKNKVGCKKQSNKPCGCDCDCDC